MHELAVAQALVDEASRVAAAHDAGSIERIEVRVGALSGVEPELLQRAFVMARAGGLCADAELGIEIGPIEVSCPACGARTTARVNKIVCGACGAWRVDIVGGEELLLLRVELTEVGGGAPRVDEARDGLGASLT